MLISGSYLGVFLLILVVKSHSLSDIPTKSHENILWLLHTNQICSVPYNP